MKCPFTQPCNLPSFSSFHIAFRYNLKRKAAEMPPLPLDAFLAKMSTHEAQMKVRVTYYRVTHLAGKNLQLTWIWDVIPPCLSCR